jgi:hypothetical protein
MRVSAPIAVANILPAAVPQLADRLVEHAIRREWRSLVGPEIARRAEPRTLAGGCLQIIVDNSPWCQEITLRAPDIVAALARRFGPSVVRSVRATVAALEPDRPSEPRPDTPATAGVSEAAMRAIEEALAPLTDDELARSVRRLLVKAARSTSP